MSMILKDQRVGGGAKGGRGKGEDYERMTMIGKMDGN